ncbi:hypothetical protein FOCC_FOCC016865 [Frankliniella occidentalis]|uniref:Uncharacterized protein LOC127751710 n=1 Tax=Frankliniella occidentalis TaxID=133901 RepID=A0A9C6X9C0_FRAOC|nr:uncharacterized protein LOC127751710 [Frankliniella occidentalis]KAE8737667.1 hypothetical protein FOCC_FOCC016865 [Frankliniella occidentalis]
MAPVRSLIRNYMLFALQRSSAGCPVSREDEGVLKTLAAYNFLKRESLRLRTLVVLAKRRMKRRWWVRPIFADRKMAGAWFSLIPVMKEFDAEVYFNFLRMTPDSFDWLLELIGPVISKSCDRREVISAGERLAITLRYMASGDSQVSLSYLFRVADCTISQIVTETTAAIWYGLKGFVFEPICEDFWRRKSAKFESMWNFPMCVGAIDGKHCFVQKFPMMGSECYNYKYGNSLILLAISDAKYKFIIVDVGARGRESDGGVFARSEFGQLFLNDQLRFPPAVFNSELDCNLPYVFLGDAAFPGGAHLLKPFENRYIPPEEHVFNYRLSRARRVVAL